MYHWVTDILLQSLVHIVVIARELASILFPLGRDTFYPRDNISRDEA